jgi:hypothetical protein
MAAFRAPLEAHCRDLFGEAHVRRALKKQKVRDGRVMLRRPRYHLAPHRDPLPGFVTLLFYLGRADDNAAYGTQLYRVTDDPGADHSQTFYPAADRCEPVVDVAYRPNRALIFLNTPGAAHGASIPRSAPRDLERYSFQAYVGVRTSVLKEIVGALPPEKQHRWAEKYRQSGAAT